jgi:hypothetical protein
VTWSSANSYNLHDPIAKRLAIYRHESAPSFSQIELAVCFYDEACDYPKETFEQITKRLYRVDSKSLKRARRLKEARRMFNLAR